MQKSFLEIGDIKAASGTKCFGSLGAIELADGSTVKIPLMVVRGVKEGPTLLLISAIHGPEIIGVEIIRRVLREEIDPKTLTGSIIALPVANPLAFQQSSYVTPYYDFYDLNRAFPGDLQGTTTARLAGLIWSAVSKSDYVIDIHAVPNPLGYGYTVVRPIGKVRIDDKALNLAKAFGLTITISKQPRIEESGRLPGLQIVASRSGIPSILVEMNGWRSWSKEAADAGVIGVLNVMKYLKMIRGTLQKQQGVVLPRSLQTQMLFANKGGLIHTEISPGASIKAGDVVARIFNVYGELVENIKTPRDGYLCAYPYMENQAVATGDYVALIGEEI
ncbi:MAG: succinylglutamate desuccinylase/aspartoacylase family protein [Nitrososphaerales archaeon]